MADPQALSPNVPVQIEDALVIPLGVFQVQPVQVFTHDPTATSSGDVSALTTVFKLGAIKGLQLDASPSYNFGSGPGTGDGSMGVDALYNFNHDTKWVPAFAIHGFFQKGFGANNTETEYTLRAIATKYLGNSDQAPRLHVNLTWTHDTGPASTARADQYSVAVGYSMLVTRSTSVVIDVVHEQKPTLHQNENFIDIGSIHDFNKDWSLAFGAGAGVAQQSPDGRIFVAIERSFQLFGGG